VNDETRPEWLRGHIETLADEITPQRDLWPGIAARLTHSRVLPRRLAVAATLVLSAGLALFGWQAYRAAEAERAATATMIAGLLAPYQKVQAEHAMRWQALDHSLDPAGLALLESDRLTIANASASLTRALSADPGDPALHLLLQQVMAREAELLETGGRIAGYPL